MASIPAEITVSLNSEVLQAFVDKLMELEARVKTLEIAFEEIETIEMEAKERE